jgi:hypothetical protein
MKLATVLVFLAVVAPQRSVFVQGHSHAAEKVRENLGSSTCYISETNPNSASAILQVDHMQARSGRSWLVFVLLDKHHRVIWEKKAEDYPWPIPSALDRLLKNMAKSTCSGHQMLSAEKASSGQVSDAFDHSQIRKIH